MHLCIHAFTQGHTCLTQGPTCLTYTAMLFRLFRIRIAHHRRAPKCMSQCVGQSTHLNERYVRVSASRVWGGAVKAGEVGVRGL